MSAKWIEIPAVRAQAHPLYGVQGWLLAVLWLNTLPVLTSAMSLIVPMMFGGWKAASATSLVAMTWAVLSLGLVAMAFLRLRWFPVVLFAYGLLQVPVAVMMGAGVVVWMSRFATWSSIELVMAPLYLLQVLGPFVTMAYAVRSRTVHVTYRHEVHTEDPAAAPAAFDLPQLSATLQDAMGVARERAALRRVAQELSSGVLDTETWVQVARITPKPATASGRPPTCMPAWRCCVRRCASSRRASRRWRPAWVRCWSAWRQRARWRPR